MQPDWRVFADAGTLVAALADALCVEAETAIAARGVFHLVLAGGTTPLALYRALADRRAGDARWQAWYGDERCLPAGHPERNNVMIEAAWLAASSIPPESCRPIPAECGAVDAATRYAGWLKDVGDFDVVLLGMGEDGHTASLFPDHDWGGAPGSPDVLAIYAAPKPPPERVSLSAARLRRSRRVWFVITGSGKREALARWKSGETLPVAAVRGKLNTAAWLDAAAWPAEA
ncbi:MAG: 6-phosphogluconolactonase [Thiobacillus sp.]